MELMSAQSNQVIPAEPATLPVSNTVSLLEVIQRAASDPNVDIDKMERLMGMHERMVARDAEAAFNEAMAACQKQMRSIAADAHNSQTKSNYATYSALDKALRPIYTAHGFSISYDTDTSPEPEHIRILAYVSHGRGHTRTYKIDMPKDGKGAKGGDVMTKTHATGAGMSYGQRYLLKGIFNVRIGEEDNDGNETGMDEDTLAEWVKKIEATTSKEAAKAVWQEGLKAAQSLKDRYAAKKLKDALIAHGEFIDKAAQ
jgi:hypothetical protein